MRIAPLVAAAALVWVGASPARAQAQEPVTAADIQQLDAKADAVADLALKLDKTDPSLAESVEKSLATLRDDITYLKVKLRREGAVSRADYQDVADRLETLRLRASNGAPDKTVSSAPAGKVWAISVGTELEARLQTALNSGTAKVEQRFEATTTTDYLIGRDVVIPAGSVLRGFVSSVRAAGKIDRTGSLTLSFDEIVIGNTHLPLRASVMQAMDGSRENEAAKMGAGAAVGAILGGLLGGGKGAIVGLMVGTGGTIAATDGSDADVPIGTILKIRLDQPLEIIG